MSAISSVFCPKKQTPLNDIENDLIRVDEGVSNVERIVKTISEGRRGSTAPAFAVLDSQSEKISIVTAVINEEISKLNDKKCFGAVVDTRRFYTIMLSLSDTALVVSGLALAMFSHNNKEKIMAASLVAAGQFFSKVNDTISSRREKELSRYTILKDYLFHAESMKSSVNSMRTCLALAKAATPPSSPVGDEIDGVEVNVPFTVFSNFAEYRDIISFKPANGNGNGRKRNIEYGSYSSPSAATVEDRIVVLDISPPEIPVVEEGLEPPRTVSFLGEGDEEVLYDVPPKLEKPFRPPSDVVFDV